MQGSRLALWRSNPPNFLRKIARIIRAVVFLGLALWMYAIIPSDQLNSHIADLTLAELIGKMIRALVPICGCLYFLGKAITPPRPPTPIEWDPPPEWYERWLTGGAIMCTLLSLAVFFPQTFSGLRAALELALGTLIARLQ